MADPILTSLRKKRGSLKRKLTDFSAFLATLRDKKLTREQEIQLESRMAVINPILEQLDEYQSQVYDLASSDETDIESGSAIEATYYTVLAEAKLMIEVAQESSEGYEPPRNVVPNQSPHPPSEQSVPFDAQSNSDTHSQTNHSDHENQYHIRLPEIPLPTFNGHHTKWLEFHDTFVALIHENNKLRNIQRFRYLQRCLAGGEAADIIANITPSNENYNIAWKLLCDRYTNKKLLIQHHLRELFSLKEYSKETASHLRELLDTTSKHLRSLKSLGLAVEQWDAVIIHLITSKFDKVTAREWESVNIQGDFPTWEELKVFLRNKADMLETLNLREIKTPKISNQKVQKVQKSYASANISCYHCKEAHAIYNCPKFLELTIKNRLETVKQLKLCSNCLRHTHKTEDCSSRSSGCKKCKRNHNTLLHDEKPESSNPSAVTQAVQVPTTLALSAQSVSSQVLLATALVQVKDSDGNYHQCRALLDSASQSSFITKALHSKLKLPACSSNISIQGINQTVSQIKFRCSVNVGSRIRSFNTNLSCLIMETISDQVPSVVINQTLLNIPENLQLADPQFSIPEKIDMLIGAQLFWSLLLPGQIILKKNLPILQNTQFGWIISGPINSEFIESTQCFLTKAVNVQEQLQQFWELEECPKQKPLSPEQQLCETFFCQTLQRDDSGKYVVSIPMKDSPDKLGDSRNAAEKRLFSVEKKLSLNSNLKEAYIQFMNEYETLGHMSRVCSTDDDKVQYFMPHHVVINQSSKTTKYRVVFDASCPSTSGISYNDLQMVGPPIQDDLFVILIRFRQHAIAFSADVQKMYRQVVVNPSDRHLQRIVWRSDPSRPIQVYELNTVTYGTASAPFLATRCLVQVSNEHFDKFPKACSIIKSDFYVYDILSGADSREEVKVLCDEISTILKTIHFKLHKWVSNSPQVLPVSCEKLAQNDSVQLGPDDTTKTLGLYWAPISDTLNYKISSVLIRGEPSTVITKRQILSQISQVFDPLGLLSACIILSKILLQELWHEKLDWDDPIPEAIAKSWLKFKSELHHINDLQIPRHVICVKSLQIELHCFSDASERAYAASIYVRSINKSGTIQVRLLCAKSKVAPLKKTTIPRLELCAAQLSAKLMTITRDSLRVKIERVFMWCDSTIVLSWLKMSPHLLKVFVSHRVADIQSRCSTAEWHHVRSEDNPADLASRGIFPSQLQSLQLWWNGPQWLSFESSNWPTDSTLISNDTLPEVKRVELTLASVNFSFPINFSRFSKFNRLQRAIAFCLRFINNCRRSVEQRSTTALTVDELNNALTILVKSIQSEVWGEEIKQIKANKNLSTNSKIRNLNPFLDDQGVMRVGGRLQASNLQYSTKHQILLPKHHVTKLLFQYEHQRLGHAGPQLLIASIRDKFWPLGARTYARLTVHNCTRCFKCKPTNLQPLMGNLPFDRVNPSMPFQFTGIDYAGPLSIRDKKGRGFRVCKSYVAVFICLAVKAIHIELVSSLTTEAFLAAFRRFISRRGKPTKMYSDNGTTFVGADRELTELYTFVDENAHHLAEALSVDGITWSFIPPNSPNFGGLWEAAVKGVKFHLKRVAGNALLTFEQLSTLLTQIECILNSRPLTPLSTDPNDLEPLSPSHFLIGRPLTALPEPSLLHLPDNRLSEFQRIQQLLQNFWVRWQREYLQTLQCRPNRQGHSPNLKVGSMVLLQDSSAPPLKWPVGRITEIFPGPDNVIRVVCVKTTRGTFKRATTKVYPLPFEQSMIHNEEESEERQVIQVN